MDTTNLTIGDQSKGYKHTPLRGEDTIRIASLSRVGNKLHAKLEQVELSDSPKYCALSYVWRWSPKSDGGSTDNNQTKPIYLDGCEIQVTANLADFIDAITVPQHEATPDSPQPPPLPYWIDANCIDQADDGEKSVQVQMMREIYNNAICVTIWLGRHDRDSGRCIAKLKMCSTIWKHFEELVNEGDLSPVHVHALFLDYLRRDPEFLDNDGGLMDREGWVKLGHFFHDRQWWDRMWTAQEYLSIAERIFLCGDSTFTPEIVDSIIPLQLILEITTVSCSEVWGLVRTQFRPLRKMAHLREDFHEKQSEGATLHFYDTLVDFRHRVATDPRDKVFAVLGLVQTDRWKDPLLSIDYALPVATVWTNVAKYLLNRQNDLDWLEYSGSSSVSDLARRQCPSWVPDWSNADDLKGLPKLRIANSGSVQPLYLPWGYRGHGVSQNNMPCIIETNDQAELHIYGAFLDEIRATYETVMSESAGNLRTYLGWIKAVEKELGVEIQYSGTYEPMWSAVLRTICVDLDLRDEFCNFTRLPAGLVFKLADLTMADRVQHIMFGTAGTSMVHKMDHRVRRDITISRRLAVTRNGYICLAPIYAQVGDQICAFAGGDVLYIVRRESHSPERYIFVGETYVHGLMDGEWRDKEGMRDVEPTLIILV